MRDKFSFVFRFSFHLIKIMADDASYLDRDFAVWRPSLGGVDECPLSRLALVSWFPVPMASLAARARVWLEAKARAFFDPRWEGARLRERKSIDKFANPL